MTVKLLLFYMDGCGWCEKFKPIWNELQNKTSYEFYQCESNDLDNSKEAKEIQTEYGHEITGFPTIFIQINNIYHKYDGDRTYDNIIEFINKYKDNNNKNDNISLYYFYMNGCSWCNKFKPVWDKLKEKTNFKLNEIEKNNINSSKEAEYIKSNNYEIKTYPSIFIKINNKIYKYEEARTIKDILNFIKNKLNYKKNNIQNGGDKSIKYRNKYKKYKKMYVELLNKYNKLSKKIN